MNVIELFRKEKMVFCIAIIMIIFGIAEIITGFRHEFFGLVTEKDTITTIVGMGLGGCYLFSGIFLLCFKKWALFCSFIFLVIDVVGRLIMVIAQMFPTDTARQIVGITGGTVIAFVFAIIVFFKYRKFSFKKTLNS